jgi:hypothetical protein
MGPLSIENNDFRGAFVPGTPKVLLTLFSISGDSLSLRFEATCQFRPRE